MQTLQLLGPVFELIERAAPRADIDHRGYDLAQLALRLVDYIVVNQASLDGSVSPTSAVDHLAQIVRRMNPSDQQRPWVKVAKMVFAALLNDGRPHIASWIEPAVEESTAPEPELFRFRLLRLTDGGDGAAVTATDEAIVLYLQALSTDLADRALALKLMVEIQLLAGELEKALSSARQATRTAEGLAASLREKLDDTRRDVRAVDWRGDMPQWLTSVLAQIGNQLDRDRQLLILAEQAAADDGARDVCRDIVVIGSTARMDLSHSRRERRRADTVPLDCSGRLRLPLPESPQHLVADLREIARVLRDHEIDPGLAPLRWVRRVPADRTDVSDRAWEAAMDLLEVFDDAVSLAYPSRFHGGPEISRYTGQIGRHRIDGPELALTDMREGLQTVERARWLRTLHTSRIGGLDSSGTRWPPTRSPPSGSPPRWIWAAINVSYSSTVTGTTHPAATSSTSRG